MTMSDSYPLCQNQSPPCGNEARYYERSHPGIFYLRWCGIHDILRNGGKGKRKDELVTCDLCGVAVWDGEEFAQHETGPRHRELAAQRAARLNFEARRDRRGEGKRR